MRRIRRFIAILVCATAGLLLVFPFALYKLGLSGIEDLPQKPLQLASKEQQALVWKRARGEGVPRIEAMNPYSFAIRLLAETDVRPPPDQLILWWVASDYLREHRRHKSMGWWHLSGVALTIWLSRNWTSEEVLSAAFSTVRFGSTTAVH
jgi:hypothetical protein